MLIQKWYLGTLLYVDEKHWFAIPKFSETAVTNQTTFALSRLLRVGVAMQPPPILPSP